MESKIKQKVMGRVRTIHAVRPFTSGAALAVVFLSISLYAIGRAVFVAQVFRNMPAVEDVAAVVRFFFYAFLNTEFLVQALTIVVLLSMLYVMRHAARTVTGLRTA